MMILVMMTPHINIKTSSKFRSIDSRIKKNVIFQILLEKLILFIYCEKAKLSKSNLESRASYVIKLSTDKEVLSLAKAQLSQRY